MHCRGRVCVYTQASAAAAVCNLVLDFSAAKAAVLQVGARGLQPPGLRGVLPPRKSRAKGRKQESGMLSRRCAPAVQLHRSGATSFSSPSPMCVRVARRPRDAPCPPSDPASCTCCCHYRNSASPTPTLPQHGGLPRLVSLLGCPSPALRHQAAWALSNMAFQAEQGVRQQLMQVRTRASRALSGLDSKSQGGGSLGQGNGAWVERWDAWGGCDTAWWASSARHTRRRAVLGCTL